LGEAQVGTAAGQPRLRVSVALLGVGAVQTLLAVRSQFATDDFWFAVALCWLLAAVAAGPDQGERGARGWRVAGAILAAAACLELVPQYYHPLHRFAPFLAGAGIALFRGPRAAVRCSRWLAILILPLAIPPPLAVRELLDPSLLTAAAARAWLGAAGVPAWREGVNLHLPSSVLEVESGCSGLGQMAELLVLAGVATAILRTTASQKLWLLVTALAVGFAGNAARIATLAWLADRGALEQFDRWHQGAVAPLWSVAAAAVALVFWMPVLLSSPRRT
jgi:exosortase